MPESEDTISISEAEFRQQVLTSLARIETILPNHETRIVNIEKEGCPKGCTKWPGIISGVVAGGGTGGIVEAVKAYLGVK